MNDKNEKMKFSAAKKYFGIGLMAFCVIAMSIGLFFVFDNLGRIRSFISRVLSILQPIIFGFVIAYILNPVMVKLDRLFLRLFKKIKKKGKKSGVNINKISRVLSVFICVILTIVAIMLLGYLLLPQLIETITKIIQDLPGHIESFNVWLAKISAEHEGFADIVGRLVNLVVDRVNVWVQTDMLSKLNTWMGYFAVGVKEVLGTVVDFIIGLIISVYLLLGKEAFIGQAKKIVYSAVPSKHANTILKTMRRSNEIFGGFISAKIVDSFIVGVLCFIAMVVLGLPYPLLISTIVGVTNVIPFFGPIIGAVPATLIILVTNPVSGLYFLILVIVLQQLDGNVIGPKIMGESTGLSAFWVVVAILLGGGLFGFVGMLIGVPVFAVIYYIVKTVVEYVLSKRNMPVETESYYELEKINPDGSPDYIDDEQEEQEDADGDEDEKNKD